ncbi:butyrate kinase [Bacillus sp. FJAT-27245]|uniref:butyrate kinase n=1 Tax=Bacillus sp. FJAT-27245 TaxID=1684144 RepID=UPI0006A75DFD|nr:butyrate kinase [Bacillus sp. FJAT-27245]
MRILVINPGGTSTKISVFDNHTEVFKKNISHTQTDLQGYKTVFQQYGYRKDLIIRTLEDHLFSLASFDCAVGRGGLLKPISGGTYEINERMIEDLQNAINGEHASNLGAVLAKNIADEIGVPAFIVDPVSVDEFQEVSRITGLSDLEKASWLHSLNQKAVCRKAAEKMGGKYEDYNFIVAHLGSGISVAAHNRGEMIDGSGGRTDGPFSPERSGGLPAYQLIKLCYSGKYTEEELVNKVSTIGGMYDYLGTKDIIEIEDRIKNGDTKAALIMDAFIYQVAKEISMYGASLYGEIDKVILTGGIAHSDSVTSQVAKRVSYLADVEVMPGEMEMEALALGALRVLGGVEAAKIYR